MAIDQFLDENEKDIDYSNFYLASDVDYMMQSDLYHSVYCPYWDEEKSNYDTGYIPAMLISNTCDVSSENSRTTNSKYAIFAPIISLDTYITDLKDSKAFSSDQIESFVVALKRQHHTNLFYLPPHSVDSKEYFVRFDQVFAVPQNTLKKLQQDLSDSRFMSLSTWAHYLFITKYSLHTCRVPEAIERE